LCLHDEKNSDLLLIFAPSGSNIMKYFSERHSLHWLVTGLYAGASANCLNLIEYCIFLSLRAQMCFERQVAVLLCTVSCLKFYLWFAHLAFQLGKLSPV